MASPVLPDSNTRTTMARRGEPRILRSFPATSAGQIAAQDGVSSVEINAPPFAEVLLINAKLPIYNTDARRAVHAAF